MKKEKKDESFPWKKVFVIAVGVLFVAMMILSAMGMSWLQSFRTVRANDTVTIDYTLRDASGQPILTTDSALYQAAILQGTLSFLTPPITVHAGITGSPAYTGVEAENYFVRQAGEEVRFGLLGQELDELNIGVLGMKAGEKKTVRFMFSDPLIIPLKDYEFAAMGGNFSTAAVGDLVPMGISVNPIVTGPDEFQSTPENSVLRIAVIVNKTPDSLEVQHRYPSAEITVREFA
jgi:hypothetical protein